MAESPQKPIQEMTPDSGEGSHDIVCPDDARTLTWLAALASRGIPCRLVRRGDGWAIAVPAAHTDAAHREIAEYERVNRDWPPPAAPPKKPLVQPQAFFASALVVVALFFWFVWVGPAGDNPAIYRHAAGDHALIQAGQWWRLVTSMTLHADFRHAFGNAATLLLFGTAVCQLAGPGIGWLAILAGGLLGGAAGVWLSPVNMTVIGASTAAFSALGILSVLQFARNVVRLGELATAWHRSWVALAAGVALLALLGTGPGTHIAGHFSGFAVGLALGLLLLPLLRRRLPFLVQIILFVLFLFIVLGSWQQALARPCP